MEKVIRTLKSGKYSTLSVKETVNHLLQVHIPNDRVDEDTPEQRTIRDNCQLPPYKPDALEFTAVDVIAAARTFKNNKAPGPDLIEVRAMKEACKLITNQFVKLFNGCLRWGVFPSIWKKWSLRVLLKSEDKDEKDPKSYRPICLLPVIGKLFEKLLKSCLDDVLKVPGALSERQFGFRAGRSTENANV